MRFAPVLTLTAVLAALLGTAASATVFEYEHFTGWDFATSGWYVDRALPSVVESESFQGDDRLHYEMVADDYDPENTFYNYRGIKYDVTMPEWGFQSFSIDLYVGTDWGTTDRNAGIWATGRNATGDISAYPILVYRNSGADQAGFYSFDYYYGGYDLLLATTGGDYDAWHNLRFDLTAGEGVRYYINDTQQGSLFSDPYTVDLQNVILNAYNFNSYQDIYYDNFQANAVPEPNTMLLLGGSLLGAGVVAWTRRRKS